MQPLDAAWLSDACREKYALGTERLQKGHAALALLSLHGALEDGLRAYLLRQGAEATGDWPTLLDALCSNRSRPLTTEDAERLRRANSLRNRVAHGEAVRIEQGSIVSYQQFVGRILRAYGVPLDQRQASRPPHGAQPQRAAGSVLRDRWDAAMLRWRTLLVPAAAILLVLAAGWWATAALLSRSGPQVVGDGRTAMSLPLRPQITTLTPIEGETLASAPAVILPGTPRPQDGVARPSSQGPLAVGGRAMVIAEADQLNLRASPGQSAESTVLAMLPAGTAVMVLEGPVQADGRAWWRIRADDKEGWCAGEFLTAQAAP